MTRELPDERMSDVDALVWNVEQQPRNRTTIAALVRFAGPLDDAELRHRVDRATRVVPRLRQRVISDPRPMAPLRWSVDPDFRLSFHFRSLRLVGGGDARLAELVRDLVVQPFDRSRPLWEFTHITGFAGDASALLLKSHHCVSDGVGGVEMMLELFDLHPEPAPAWPALPAPCAAPATATTATWLASQEAASLLGEVRTTLGRLAPPTSLSEATTASRRLGEVLGSAARMFRPVAGAGPVPSVRSDEVELRFFSRPLADLRTAGRRVDGTVNDAFVSAVAIGVTRHYGREAGRPLRISVPVNTRNGESASGNHWAPGRIDVDPGLAGDDAALMAAVKSSMRRVRCDPAHELLPPLASGLRRLPAPATAALFASFSAALDVAASNVPGSPVPLYLCGRKVDAVIPFGPLSGCAVNVTLLSHEDTAHIGVASDPAAVADPDRLLADLQRGFDLVIEGQP